MDANSLNTLFHSTYNPFLMAQGMREADTAQSQALANLYAKQQETSQSAQKFPTELEQAQANVGHTRATTGYQNELSRQLQDKNNLTQSIPFEQRVAAHLAEVSKGKSAAELETLNNSFKMIPAYLSKAQANGGKLPLEDLQYIQQNQKHLVPFVTNPELGAKAYQGFELFSKQGVLQGNKQEFTAEQKALDREAALARAKLALQGKLSKGNTPKDFKMNSEQTMNYYRKLASETGDKELATRYEDMANRAELQYLRAIQVGAEVKAAGTPDITATTKGKVPTKPTPVLTPTPKVGAQAPQLPALPPGFKLD